MSKKEREQEEKKQHKIDNQTEIKKIASMIKQSREELEHYMFMIHTLQLQGKEKETNENSPSESTGPYKDALTEKKTTKKEENMVKIPPIIEFVRPHIMKPV